MDEAVETGLLAASGVVLVLALVHWCRGMALTHRARVLRDAGRFHAATEASRRAVALGGIVVGHLVLAFAMMAVLVAA